MDTAESKVDAEPYDEPDRYVEGIPVSCNCQPVPGNIEDLELTLLTEGIYQKYGFDFRDYSHASLKRRILRRVTEENLNTVSGLQERILHDVFAMERLITDLSINTTSMFRDTEFYTEFRNKVVPLLKTYPYIRLWLAGCSTGEEVYSMAILLFEEGLYKKSRIYATDMSAPVLKKAKDGIFKLKNMKEYTTNYQKSGGIRPFSEYYTAKYENAIIRDDLKDNIVFFQHNLATDSSFNEFHVILCRNVMIYFNESLSTHVHRILYDSLIRLGVLALGAKESITLSSCEEFYEDLDASQKLYRKVK